MTDLFKTFQGLRQNNSDTEDTTLVEGIPDRFDHKIGISKVGLPLFFIATTGSGDSTIDINLRLIQVEFQKKCELISDDGTRSDGIYTIVSLKSDSEEMVKYFINTVYYLINQLDPNPSFAQIKMELNTLVDLFRSLSNPPIKTIQGLWSELLFIEQSFDPSYLINCWHLSKSDRYDFNDGIDKLEVKSTSKGSRIHSFSQNQLQEVKNTMVLIGSTFAIETGNGKSINDLIEDIKNKINEPSLLFKLLATIAETLGAELERIYDIYFDYTLAINSIKYYNIEDIPKIDNSLIPIGVTNVKFDCDLTGVVEIDKNLTNSKLLEAIFI